MSKLKFLMVVFILFVFAFAGNANATNGHDGSNSTDNYTGNNNTTLANESNELQNISDEQSQLSTMDFYCDMDGDGFTGEESSVSCPSDVSSMNCNLTKISNCDVIDRQNESIILLYENTRINCSVKRGVDCNDHSPSINPNAAEICNGIDDNCNNKTDNDEKEDICPLLLYYCDRDGDGFISILPSGNCSTFNCIPSKCQNEHRDDCDDNDAAINTTANMEEVILKHNKTREINLTATEMENSKILINVVSLLFYLFVAFAVVVVLSWIVFREKFHH